MPRITIDLSDEQADRLRARTGKRTTAAALAAALSPLVEAEQLPNSSTPARRRARDQRLVEQTRNADRRGGFEARKRHVPMTELVRQAIRTYRTREESQTRPTLQTALAQTAGIWRQGDGLAWQQRMRKEWERPN